MTREEFIEKWEICDWGVNLIEDFNSVFEHELSLPPADGAEEMKEHIIHILQTHISAIQLCNDDDPIEIVGINTAADEIIKIADKMESERAGEILDDFSEYLWKIGIAIEDEDINEYLKSRER